MATYRTDPHLAKPTPAHALTPEAEVARGTVRDLPPQRVVRDGGVVGLTRKPLTRAEVVADYIHPAAESFGKVKTLADVSRISKAAAEFGAKCEDAGADVKFTYARGTTYPKWHVPADTPVDPADYHGTVVDSVVVWARKLPPGLFDPQVDPRIRIRAEWHDGRSQGATINGVKAPLRDALEALR